MEGNRSPGPGADRKILVLIGVVLALVIALSAAVYFGPGSILAPSNTPPYDLGIEVIPAHPTDAAPVGFFANVSDHETPTSAVEVRWAWQTAGTWDTNWSTNKAAQHRFAAGTYTIRLEAEDSGGLTAATALNVTVEHAPPPPPVLRIGTIFSLTGALAAYGPGQQNGVDMAVAEINAAGGVLGSPIVAYHTDDQTTPSVAQQDAQTLVLSDHVAAIIGATSSGSCAMVAPVASTNHVVEISPSCTSPVFTNASYNGGWFARTVPSDALQATVAAYYARYNLSLNYTAVIGINNAYGVDTAAAYASTYKRLGGNLTDDPPLTVNEVFNGAIDYTAALTQIMSASPPPQLIYLVAYPPDGVQMLKDWDALLGSHPAWASVRWMFSEGLYDQTGFINPLVSAGVNVSRFLGTAPALYGALVPPGYSAWAARYQARFGSAPTLFAANAYDAAYLAALAAQAERNVTGAGIRNGLRLVANPPGTVVGPGAWSAAAAALETGQDVNYEGASGSVNVNATGDVPAAMIVWAVDGANQLYTKDIFNESLVVSIQPPGTFAPPSLASGFLIAAAWGDSP